MNILPFDLNTLILYIGASIALAFAPGPDNIFVLTQSITGGRSSGIKVTLGLSTGLIFHTALVALGISAIFQTSIVAFNILKYIGAVYLLFLSYKAFKASSDGFEITGKKQISSWKLYGRGVIMNITNPKVSIFFMAFLPQFTNPAKGSITLQIILLGIIFIITTILVFGLISLLSGTIGNYLLKSKNSEKYLNRFAGLVFMGLALKLAVTRQ